MKIFFSALGFIVIGIFVFLGLTLANSRGCRQLVIDTSEIYSGIDIPRVTAINCYYDAREKVRTSIYKIRLNDFHVEEYLTRHGFKPAGHNASRFAGIQPDEQPGEDNLYLVSGDRWGARWRYLVEKDTKRLWVEIAYH